MLSIDRRQSRSMCAGISFEDQINAIDPGTSTFDRLQRLLQICASTSLRNICSEIAEDSDNDFNETINDVCVEMRKKSFPQNTAETTLVRAAELIDDMTHTSSKKKVLPSRVRMIREYTKKLEDEADCWKHQLEQRREEYLRCRAENKAVARGEKRISAAMCQELSVAELLQTSIGEGELKRLIQQEARLRFCENEVCVALKKGKKRSLDASAHTDAAVKRLIAKSRSFHREELACGRSSAKNLVQTVMAFTSNSD